MRIVFVTQVMLSRPFGGARHVLAVAAEWAELGHDVTLVAPGLESNPNAKVRRVRPPAHLKPGARLEMALAGLATQQVVLRRPDVAYVRISATSSVVPMALKLARIPVVLELNGRILVEMHQLGRSKAAIAVVQSTLRIVVASAKALVAVEAKIGRHATEALGAHTVHVIENGADIRNATPGDRAQARKALQLPKDAQIIAFAGTLVPELRLDLLLGALELLPEAHLVVAGDGPAMPVLSAAQSKLPKRLHLLGSRSHADAVNLLRAADVCVNVRDGDMGMKCLEYAALGRRFVAFEVEGAQRLTGLYPKTRAAFLVESRSAGALAEALSRALQAEAAGALPKQEVDAARALVGWDRTAGEIAKVLGQAILSEGAAGPTF